jgi:hypothetical protein
MDHRDSRTVLAMFHHFILMDIHDGIVHKESRRARWPRGPCARREIAEAKAKACVKVDHWMLDQNLA